MILVWGLFIVLAIVSLILIITVWWASEGWDYLMAALVTIVIPVLLTAGFFALGGVIP
jgi:hypothetical protein|tara:strand:- start:18 stop:191 length:174 start_codon:yes stop_codon:yes gene_type:complete